MQKDNLVLIDGNSLLYRAFYAMPHFSTLKNQPTNAAYGFTLMMMKIIEDIKPNIIIVTFDAHAKTFRHDEFAEYKAHRKPMPDDLISQGPIVREIVKAFNIPIYEIEGYEADDVVGTIAKKAEANGFDVSIVTGDLDELQLITDSIKVITTQKGVTETIVYDEQAVFERYNLKPNQLPDYKGLKGDPSDNIPGVSGIGDKIAQKLIGEYGSLENLYANLDNVKEKRIRSLLIESKDISILSKKLATIVIDVPLDIDFNQSRYKDPAAENLIDIFKKLEFRSLLNKFTEKSESVEQPDLFGSQNRTNFELTRFMIIKSVDELKHLKDDIFKHKSINFVSNSIYQNSNRKYAINDLAIVVNNMAYVLTFDENFTIESIKDIFESDAITKNTYDLKNEIRSLNSYNITIRGKCFDTMIASYLLNPSRSSYSINDLAYEFIDNDISNDTEADIKQNLADKCSVITRLKDILANKLSDNELYEMFENIEMPLIPVLADIEKTGINTDIEQLNHLSDKFESMLSDLQNDIYQLAGLDFNIGSPKQLQNVLFEKLGLPSAKKTKTGYSTDADTLRALIPAHEIIPKIIDYRELSKLKSTYADSLPKLVDPTTKKIYTTLNQTVAATGRLSSSDPNLQNIPIKTEYGREIRQAFIASNGNMLLSADYSQIELRILAHISHDPELINAFKNNDDIHTRTAATIFGVAEENVSSEMRRQAKTVNFAVIYGMSDYGLSRELGIPVSVAKKYIEDYFKQYPGVKWYTDEILESARNTGYVKSLSGRKRYVPEIKSQNRQIRELTERAAVNMPIQATAADIIKIAMIDISDKLKNSSLKAKMILQVHDELLFDIPEDEIDFLIPIIKDSMENSFKLDVPIKIELKYGKNWNDMSIIDR